MCESVRLQLCGWALSVLGPEIARISDGEEQKCTLIGWKCAAGGKEEQKYTLMGRKCAAG
ncbi:hypothetical protein HQN87_29030 [Paenibacillus tritici]|uniref:Uncharacterized protein n=1 Tax=Paenibacillus tritici TaxID=1873425 RepID=A0ABX2DZQ1_9BACL|nr:hypothetical protein [Paenibacillus tritici]NQX49366.1 hypothetical protein [Paenibacillus tritici]